MKRRDTVGIKFLRPPMVKVTQLEINNSGIPVVVKKQKLNPPEVPINPTK